MWHVRSGRKTVEAALQRPIQRRWQAGARDPRKRLPSNRQPQLAGEVRWSHLPKAEEYSGYGRAGRAIPFMTAISAV